eukprot:3726246-Alexandrium_andersonii.AAC.1
MSASLVGSEMCIRDRLRHCTGTAQAQHRHSTGTAQAQHWHSTGTALARHCLLYTSDAADDSSV